MRLIVNYGTKQTGIKMLKQFLLFSFSLYSLCSYSQKGSLESFLADSSMIHASVSLYIAETDNQEVVLEYNSGRSLTPASVMKLITSAAALELLGPQYTFKTVIGYTGVLNKKTGKLKGDIVIRGGGDPALGSPYFADHYNGFLDVWVSEIKKLGIKKIEGRVITDDSYYDYQPVPAKWLWEDAGNYYGAGVYGLSVFDNTYDIHFMIGADSQLVVKDIIPDECRIELSNWLITEGTSDDGYVFAAPYSTNGWMAGTIPSKLEDYVLKASVADPPGLMAKTTDKKLKNAGITVSKEPTTFRLEQITVAGNMVPIAETISPPLSEIIEILNHESVNLYAEHLIKELGKKFSGQGSTEAGVEIVMRFLNNSGIGTDGMFIVDGSGLSPVSSINARGIANVLCFMKNKGRYFPEYLNSLPEAGKEGTLKNYFRDPVFDSRLKAKSGSMTRVRSYAGYFTTISGKQMVFSIIINNYSGTSRYIITGIEEIIKETILNK
jgi:D-alanyl-D-alanine carboxypeptidase/D-alanyl-D-alanine-endopeptidase (penicillin-binding protein 4)